MVFFLPFCSASKNVNRGGKMLAHPPGPGRSPAPGPGAAAARSLPRPQPSALLPEPGPALLCPALGAPEPREGPRGAGGCGNTCPPGAAAVRGGAGRQLRALTCPLSPAGHRVRRTRQEPRDVPGAPDTRDHVQVRARVMRRGPGLRAGQPQGKGRPAPSEGSSGRVFVSQMKSNRLLGRAD